MTEQYAKRKITAENILNDLDKMSKGAKDIIELQSITIAQDAIKSQIPLKPALSFHDEGIILYKCPRCEARYHISGKLFKYCPDCGQALDWSEVEE